MPPGGHVVTSQHVTTSNASYDDTVITTGTSTYDFTIYEKFSSAELDHFRIPRLRLPWGIGWIGSNTSSQRSVYCLSNFGVGVYVTRKTRLGGDPSSLKESRT